MALATRCPHCETVFKLDPHLLAPHDGRVRCGHCQEVFDAAHHRFELPEDNGAPHDTQHAAIIDDDVAVGPSTFSAPPAPSPVPPPAAPDREPSAPPPEPPKPKVAAPRTLEIGARMANQPPAPVATPTPVKPASRASAPIAPDEDSDKTVYANAPVARNDAPPPPPKQPEAANEPAERAQVKQFIRVNTEQDERKKADAPQKRFVEPVDDRAEPFIGTPRPAPTPPPPPPPPPQEKLWRDDAEPGFGAPPPSSVPPGATRPASANETFPATREPRQPSEPRAPARPRKGMRAAGIVLAVLLGLLLIGQIAWWQRETVMVLIPGSHSLYVDVCDQLDCTINPPRYIDGLQIESSGLRQVDGPHKLELKLSLRNRSDVSLAYPALELTLLDDKSNVAVRRVLWPQDYARPGTIFPIGLPPQSAQPVVVRLDTGEAVAANYRVQVFYP